MNRFRSLLLLPIVLLAGAAFAAAQTDPPPPSDQEEQPDATLGVQQEFLFVRESLPYLPSSNTIASKLPTSLQRTPANVGVVTATTIEEQDAQVLGDALENVSGLNVQTFNGVFDLFVIRGFDSVTSGLVLTDGAPEPEATFYQLYNAERIEVLKGPAGFLYGSNPMAGAVNIVREQPVPANFGVVGGSVGSFDTLEGHLDLNRASEDGRLSFRVNGIWRESDGWRDDIDSSAAAINPAFTWAAADGSSLNVNAELAVSDYRPDAGLPILNGQVVDVPRERSYGSPFDDSAQDVGRFQVDFERPLGDDLRLRNKLYYRSLDWDTAGTLLSFVIPSPDFTSLEVTRSLLQLDDQQQFMGNQLELLYSTTVGRVSHTLVAGVEVGRYEDEFSLDVAFLPSIDIFQPVERAAQPLFPLPGQSQAGDSRASVVAPYLVDQIGFGERFQVLVGLRFDNIDFEDRATGVERDDSETSPMLGLVYSPTRNLALYANAGRSFSPPSPRVTAGQQEPEESRQFELGLRQTFLSGRGRATLAVYELERENIAIPDDNGFTQQTGDQRARGVELEVGARFANGLSGQLAYAYTDSELTRFTEQVLVSFLPPTFLTVDRSGNRSTFAPEHLLNLWLSRHLGQRWTLGGGLRWVDTQFIAEDNVTELDSYMLFDASVAYLVGNWRLSLNLKNLGDEEYETRGFGGSSVIPGAPAAAFLSFEYRL